MKRQILRTVLGVSALLAALSGGAASAATINWEFDEPIGVGLDPLMVATLSISDIAGGVRLLLTPEWSNLKPAVPPTCTTNPQGNVNCHGGSAGSTINALDIIGTASLGAVSFLQNAGVAFTAASYDPSGFSGESYNPWRFHFEWNEAAKFDAPKTSTWDILGVGLDAADFADSFAASTNNPNRPEYARGIIFLSPAPVPGDSKYLAVAGGPTEVPEPATGALIGLGLLAFQFGRKRKQS